MTPAPAAGPSNLAHLPQSYLNAVTKPTPGTYEGEIPNASWIKVLIGIAIVALVGLLTSFIAVGAANAQFDEAIRQMQTQGQPQQVIDIMNQLRVLAAAGPISALIGPFITFFLGAGVQYLAAKTVGGSQGGDFLRHAYLSSLSYAPLHTAASLVGIVPVIGACIALVIYIYQIFCVGVSMQSSQRMQAGRAQLSAFSPFILWVLLTACFCVAIFVLAATTAGR